MKKAMRTLKLVNFDMDGLLIDSERAMMTALSWECIKLGCQLNEDYYRTRIGGKETPDVMKLFHGATEDSKELIHATCEQTWARSIEEMLQAGVPMKKGVRELLAYLKKHNILCAVSSSSERYKVETLLTGAGIYDSFDYIICGDEIENGKPNPDIFLKACKELGVPPENSIVLEDSNNGGLAALRGGISYIIIPDIAFLTDEVTGHALSVADSLLDVPEIIGRTFKL